MHVKIHGYIVTVLDVNIYAYICSYILIKSIYYINIFVGIWNRLWISLHYSVGVQQ